MSMQKTFDDALADFKAKLAKIEENGVYLVNGKANLGRLTLSQKKVVPKAVTKAPIPEVKPVPEVKKP